ncbi:MAG: hypothetical protein DRP47_04240 [Candidatus Zixiibacteriota bacterium]|nr:MAG: hypothetical protein DRP47_04240 [candidate division Zixibacteria bacterium]
MDIGLVYSREDPRQAKVRDFVINYIRERGILAKVTESVEPVNSPTLIINGRILKDMRSKPRQKRAPMFPDKEDMARALDQHAWEL